MPCERARPGIKKMDAPGGRPRSAGRNFARRRPSVAGRRSSVNDFAVKGEVEAVALDVFRDAQADDRLDDGQDDDGDDRVIDDDRHDADALIDDLAGVALEEAGGAAVLLNRKHAGQKRPDHAADAVDAEAVERVVISESVLEAGRAPVAADAAGDADRDRADRTDETGRGSNG